MSESREYYSRSEQYGDVYISEEVLEMIAGAAALEVDGVTGLAGGTMSEQILGRKKLSKGITILWESDNITINVSIQIRYGGIIPELAKKVQEAIVTSVEATSGLKVAAVNVLSKTRGRFLPRVYFSVFSEKVLVKVDRWAFFFSHPCI